MTNDELIIIQAKRLAEDAAIQDFYRKRCDSLEAELRVKNNITESNDDLPLTPVGAANKQNMEANSGGRP